MIEFLLRFLPPTRPELVSRPRLIERLNAGLHRKLTLISAPAGFGKTTLVGEWVAGSERPVAWLSLDESEMAAAYQARLEAVEVGIPCTQRQ